MSRCHNGNCLGCVRCECECVELECVCDSTRAKIAAFVNVGSSGANGMIPYVAPHADPLSHMRHHFK